ncbi:MAG: methyltransferase domain-containing protein [Deltaproteobacteria bacterium]|nr:methyltransferase domain-containing protein [Deltaproteobacteria bacterium]
MSEAEEFKACCADFYADDVVRRILGDSFHPGGLDLTRRLLEAAHAGPDDRLLDVAAGQGSSAALAAEETGCSVVALDLSAENLLRAAEEAARRGLGDRFETRLSDAEQLPFEDETFDVILCECAFCTFPDKQRAAHEMFRVLRPGGRLALSDITIVRERFPQELNTLLARVACIADALPTAELAQLLEDAGFAALVTTDASWALGEMVEQIRGRLLAVELAGKLAQLDLGAIDLEEGKRMITGSMAAIRKGSVGYVTLVGARG